MKAQTIIFLVSHFCFILLGQDTIFFHKNQIEVGKVIEIGSTQIRYTRNMFKNGPIYVMNNSDIDSIRFNNGSVERFRVKKEVKAATTKNAGRFQKIVVFKNTFLYDNKRLKDSKLIELIMTHPDVARRKILLEKFERMKRYSKTRNFWFMAGPIFAGTILITAYGAVESFGDADHVPAMAGFSATTFAGCAFTTVAFHQSYKAKKHEIVQLYNEAW